MGYTMKRMKTWIMQMSIREKLVFYSYAIIAPILLLISVLLFIRNYHNAMQQEDNACLQNVQSLSENLETMEKRVYEIGTYICINEDITAILKADNPEILNQNGQLWTSDAPMQIIQDMIAINGQIKTIAIYPENGVRPYLRCMDSSSHYGSIAEVSRQEIYQEAVEKKGAILWRRVGKHPEDTYLDNLSDKIVMYREIYDLSRKKQLGFLIIGTSAEKYDELCQNALRNDREAVVVMSDNGMELVRCGTIEEKALDGILGKKIPWSRGRNQLSSFISEGYRVYAYRNASTGMIVYKMVPKASIMSYLDTVIYGPLALLLGVLIGLYPIMILISNLVSKPLQSLCAAMEKFKQGDFSQRVEVTTLDEVGEASACFNSMVEDIRVLIDENYVMELREKESELDALQAQINPHFLYNTLDSLYWKATEAGADEIAEDIIALSQLFRLVLNRGKGIITVRQEKELLEHYLHIQKMRFGKRLCYRICIQESLLEEEFPKLILQPFVENSIVHGFEKGNDSFSLSIIGEASDSDMVFYVQDTGVGMSQEQIERIWKVTDDKKYANQRIGRYAIKNVKERLQLIYHEDFELSIQSKEGVGTTVMIRIPRGRCTETEEQIDTGKGSDSDEYKIADRG